LNQDPAGVFGGLLMVCIGEESANDLRRIAKVDIAFFFLGIVSSAITTYFLLQLGVVV
jgi:hypothetical protein